MSAGRQRVVMLGFDAMDPALTERMARGGRLPAFDELFGSACAARDPRHTLLGIAQRRGQTSRGPRRAAFTRRRPD